MANKKRDAIEEAIRDGEEMRKRTTKIIVICLSIVCVIAITVFVVYNFVKPNFQNMINSQIGNTISNIRNYGYATSQGEWIYYIAPSENASKTCIYKIKVDGTGKGKLLETDRYLISLNYYDGYVYFISTSDEANSAEDEKDNRIYRINTNGDLTPEIVNDNKFNNDCLEIYIIKGELYFIGEDMNIYKINLKSFETSLVCDNKTGYIGINEKYILFNKVVNEETYECVTYIMSLDGKDARPVIDGQRIYSVAISDDDYIYYTNTDKKLFRVKIDSNKPEVVSDVTAYNMNLYGKYIYFYNYKDEANQDFSVCIYRVRAGKNKSPKLIKEINTFSAFLDVAGGRLMYTDGENARGFINFLDVSNIDNAFRGYEINYDDYVPPEETNTVAEN